VPISKKQASRAMAGSPAGTSSACAKGGVMQMIFSLQPLIALIAGILILIMPRLLNLVVAIYLIVIGILGLSHGRF
jgi:hypothetical protein